MQYRPPSDAHGVFLAYPKVRAVEILTVSQTKSLDADSTVPERPRLGHELMLAMTNKRASCVSLQLTRLFDAARRLLYRCFEWLRQCSLSREMRAD